MTGCSRSALGLIVLLAKKGKKSTMTIIELNRVMENISVFLAYEVKPHYFFKVKRIFWIKSTLVLFIESSLYVKKFKSIVPSCDYPVLIKDVFHFLGNI